MKIEPLELFRDKGIIYLKGEVRIVSDTDGALYCQLGWAKDLDGKIETGTRKPGASELKIDNIQLNQVSEVK